MEDLAFLLGDAIGNLVDGVGGRSVKSPYRFQGVEFSEDAIGEELRNFDELGRGGFGEILVVEGYDPAFVVSYSDWIEEIYDDSLGD
jgi:hypothetical protein